MLALSSVTWGTCFAKSGAKAIGGHSSAAAKVADAANLALARKAETAIRKANGDTPAQKIAVAANLAIARADKAAKKAASK